MIKCSLKWLSTALLSSFSVCLFAIDVPPPPMGDASAYIVVDYNSHAILAEKDARKKIDPASMTKMMTVYVLDNQLKQGRFKLTDEVPISKNAWQIEGSRMFVEVGKKITANDLIRGVIIQSGNDATVALAEFAAGSEESFANLMNQYAQRIGMKDSHFMNSTGIPHPNHYTTAYDLSLLARALIRDFPDTYKIYSEKWYTFNGIKQPNRNQLLWREPYVDGIKTGHSSTAGYCLASSGVKDNMRIISILAGAKSEHDRTEESLQLLRYGFRFFETHPLYAANQALNQARVWYGNKPKLPLGVAQNVYITVPQGQYKNLQAKVELQKPLSAPIIKGQTYGKLVVKLNDKTLSETPLVALENVSKGGVWSRFSDYISLSLNKYMASKVEPSKSA